jgi:hypothetical protein
MANIPRSFSTDIQNAKYIFLLIGIVCLAGFSLGILAIGLPPNFSSLEWRVDFLQQFGDRSITLMLGAALTMWGLSNNRSFADPEGAPMVEKFKSSYKGRQKHPAIKQRRWRQLLKQLAFFCLMSGIVINLLSIVVIHDTLEL